MGDQGYNIIESNIRESLIKTRAIMREILAECRARMDKSEKD